METFFYTKSIFKEIYNDIGIIDFFRFTPKTKSELKQAIDFYYNNRQEGIAKYGIMNEWNTILITDMSRIFKSMLKFNEPIGNWNTSNVTNMKGMFAGASNFNQPIGNWDTSNVTDMCGMFEGVCLLVTLLICVVCLMV